MHLGQGESHQYTMGSGGNQIAIEMVKIEKDLGGTIDNELNFENTLLRK